MLFMNNLNIYQVLLHTIFKILVAVNVGILIHLLFDAFLALAKKKCNKNVNEYLKHIPSSVTNLFFPRKM